MNKKLVILLASLALCVACSDDAIGPQQTSVKNDNVNGFVSNGVTENKSTNLTEVAKRMEMPRLKGGSSNLFVAHTVSTGEVNYCMEYDCSRLASLWTAYQWYVGFSSNDSKWNRNAWKNGETFNGYGGDSDPFQPDPLIPRDYQTTLEDHSRNGYDRGHMLGSADRLNSKDANGQTFYLSNMHPQSGGFNQGGIWYNLEIRLRNQYDKSSFRDTLYVVKGGTIADGQTLTSVKGASGRKLIVPKYFYMALLCKNTASNGGGYKAIAFWMEHKSNNDSNYANYAITIDELEEKTGIDFFCNLPDDIENAVEANTTLAAWGM